MKRLTILVLLSFFAFSLFAANYDGILNGANASANVSWKINESNLSFTSVVFSNDKDGISPLADSFGIDDYTSDIENKKITAEESFYVVWSIFTNESVSVAMKFKQDSNSSVTTDISAKYGNNEVVNISSDDAIKTIYTHESSENTSLDKGYATIYISVSADADGLSFGENGINLGTLTVTVKTEGGTN